MKHTLKGKIYDVYFFISIGLCKKKSKHDQNCLSGQNRWSILVLLPFGFFFLVVESMSWKSSRFTLWSGHEIVDSPLVYIWSIDQLSNRTTILVSSRFCATIVFYSMPSVAIQLFFFWEFLVFYSTAVVSELTHYSLHTHSTPHARHLCAS